MKATSMKRFVLFVSILCLSLSSSAFTQTGNDTLRNWEKGGMGALTFNQIGLFNWAAGGQSNITLIGNLNLFANRTWENSKWENTLDLAYGFIKNNFIFDPDARIAKAEDKIDFSSKYGMKGWNEKVSYSALLNFRSQFDYGRVSPLEDTYISRFMSPGYVVFAIGLDYKPKNALSIFVSPVSGKATFVTDDSLAATAAFGVNQIKENGDFYPGCRANSRVELGATVRVKYKDDIMENISLESQLELFSNYIDRPQNIDIRWNNAIVARVNKFITVNLFTDLIYDHDIKIGRVLSDGTPEFSINPEPIVDPATGLLTPGLPYWPGPNYSTDPTNVVQVQKKGPITQFKEIFGVGLAYKF